MNSQPPTAIRYRYFLYRFATDHSSSWWTRVPVSKPFVILRSNDKEIPRRFDPYDERQNAIFISAIGLAYSFTFSKLFAIYFSIIGLFLIFADYAANESSHHSMQCTADVTYYNTVWFVSSCCIGYLISLGFRRSSRRKRVMLLLLCTCFIVYYSGQAAWMCRDFFVVK